MSYSIFADESGTDVSHKCYTIGALVIPTNKVLGFNREFERLKTLHGVENELKWTKINKSYGSINFAIDLLLCILHNNFRLGFIVVKKDNYRKWWYDKESAFYTSYTMLFKESLKMSQEEHLVYIDSRQDNYAKNDEVVGIISNHMLAQISSGAKITNVKKCDSKKVLPIQAIDLFTGAINASHNLLLDNKPINNGKSVFIKKSQTALA